MHVRDVSPEKHKTLVLIHGQIFDSTYWDDALPSFDARVLLPDMPGLGKSAGELVEDWPRMHDSLERALLARTSQPVHLVGYSLGSYHALVLALRGKLKVLSLTMLGPFPGNDQPALDALAALAVAVRSGALSWVDVVLNNCFSQEFISAHPATVARTRERISRCSVHALLEELARCPLLADLRPRLGELTMPVLVRVGDRDPSTKAEVGEAIAKSSANVRLEIVPGVAHDYLTQDFEGTVASIKRFTGC